MCVVCEEVRGCSVDVDGWQQQPHTERMNGADERCRELQRQQRAFIHVQRSTTVRVFPRPSNHAIQSLQRAARTPYWEQQQQQQHYSQRRGVERSAARGVPSMLCMNETLTAGHFDRCPASRGVENTAGPCMDRTRTP